MVRFLIFLEHKFLSLRLGLADHCIDNCKAFLSLKTGKPKNRRRAAEDKFFLGLGLARGFHYFPALKVSTY